MLRISKLTDYGTLVLAQLAARSGELTSAGDVAQATHLTQPTASKLLKALARAGLVVSARGARGGYALARAPAKITAAEIIDALEGPVAITECSLSEGACTLEEFCRVGRTWQHINHSIRAALENVTLDDLRTRRDPLPTPDFKSALQAPAR